MVSSDHIIHIFLLAVYSSTGTLAYRYQQGNTEYYLVKHFIILIFGLVLMYIAHLIKYTYLFQDFTTGYVHNCSIVAVDFIYRNKC